MWPKFNFLSIILCTMLMLVPDLFIASVFLIFCCHFTFNNNLLRHFILKARSRFMSLSSMSKSQPHTSRLSLHIISSSWFESWFLYSATLSWIIRTHRLPCQFYSLMYLLQSLSHDTRLPRYTNSSTFSITWPSTSIVQYVFLSSCFQIPLSWFLLYWPLSISL